MSVSSASVEVHLSFIEAGDVFGELVQYVPYMCRLLTYIMALFVFSTFLETVLLGGVAVEGILLRFGVPMHMASHRQCLHSLMAFIQPVACACYANPSHFLTQPHSFGESCAGHPRQRKC